MTAKLTTVESAAMTAHQNGQPLTGATLSAYNRAVKKLAATEAPAPVEAPADAAATPAQIGAELAAKIDDPDTATAVQALSDRVDAAHAAAKKATARKPASVKTRKAAKATETAPAEATPTTDEIEKAAAELAAESAESMPTNGHAVVEFFRHIADTGAMNEKTARNYMGLFRSVIRGGHAHGLNADVTKINVDAVWERYIAATPTLLDSTAKVYRQFYTRAVKLFIDYTANPQGWTPTGRSEARRPRMAHQDFDLGNGNTLRVTHTPSVDVKDALEAALASLTADATANA